MDDVQPKFLLIDKDEQICGSCLDAEGVFVEALEDDELVTVEILGCLPSQQMRDHLSGSKRYRQRNPLGLEALLSRPSPVPTCSSSWTRARSNTTSSSC
ncbi:hypothetical protein ABZ260_51560, partial [Streptosporangium sp. NPDC006013]|uniref:hypothetical protein n=1 Tax=Streptosporangium sp. NPDC006013 TaxID=3155596 RepID=UPI0033BBE342